LNQKSGNPERTLKIKTRGNDLILESERWAFAVVIEAPTSQVVLTQSPSEPTHYTWEDQVVGSSVTPSSKTQQLNFTLNIYHASPKMRPLKRGAPEFKGEKKLREWSTLLDFLSSGDGVIDGFGEQGTTRQWAGLAVMALLDQAQFTQLSAEFCEATLSGALRSLPAWPQPFRAYKRPLKPFDGRLFLPISLTRYLLDHPRGKKRVSKFLKQKWSGQMISGIISRHLQDLIGRGAFFANRPSKRHLIAIHPNPDEMKPNETLRYGYFESVVLMPRALKSIARLLGDPKIRALVSAPISLELRANKVFSRWNEKARGFFGRQLEVYEARRRVENWGRFLALDDPQSPALNIRHNLKHYEELLNEDPPSLSGFSGLDLLWGQHDQNELNRLLNTARPFPAGVVTSKGMVARLSLPFVSELSAQPVMLMTPTTSVSALWILGLNRQIRRRWPYKITAKLEDTREAIWVRLISEATSSSKPDPKTSSTQNKDQTDQSVLTPNNSGQPQPQKPEAQPASKLNHTYQENAWFSDHLSALDSLAASLKAPPPIKPATNVDVRELR